MKKRLRRKLASKKRATLIGKVIAREPVVRPSKVAIIYRSELDFISRCILDRTNIETGGQLFGFWTGSGVPVVLFAIGPGPRANHQMAFFNQDVNYLVSVGKLLVRKYGLQHIGEWHSHHQLGLACPSGHDASTMVNSIRRRDLGKFLLAIGNCTDTESTLNAFTFTQSACYDYEHAAWDVKEVASPYRALIAADFELNALIVDPVTKIARHGKLLTVKDCGEFTIPVYAEDYWLKDRANNLLLKEIIDFLSGRSVGGGCTAQLDGLGQVHLIVEDGGEEVRIIFAAGFPVTPPLVTFNGHECAGSPVDWNFDGDIKAAFIDYYLKLKGTKQ